MTLFSDLDGTLVYSRRYRLRGPSVTAERIGGRDQGFMTDYTYRWLRVRGGPRFIPVSSRDPGQYARLVCFTEDFCCRHVLLCNGGLLLTDGRQDQRWLRETREMTEDSVRELAECRRYLEMMFPSKQIHFPEKLMIYIRTEEPGICAGQMREKLSPETVRIMSDRHKVYVIPGNMDKGSAVKRYVGRFGSDLTAAAGDSSFDIPMLEITDHAIAHGSLKEKMERRDHVYWCDDPVFSDEICRIIDRIGGER